MGLRTYKVKRFRTRRSEKFPHVWLTLREGPQSLPSPDKSRNRKLEIHMDGYQELRYFPRGGNTTETVVSTSTGTPFINVGSYRHCSTALTAYHPQVSGPETYLALLTAPSLPMST